MSSNYIFSQMDIVKIIGSYGIKLTKVKDNEYHGSIPPVGNSGESLHVWPSSNTWYCNKNHVGGGILDFLQFIDKCTPKEAFLKACDISGVQPYPSSDVEINNLEEQEEVFNTLTLASRLYHENLTQEIYNFIFDKWGITPDSVDEWSLGYAKLGRNLRDLDPKTLIKTGLVFTTESGNPGGEYYQDRIIFPFYINGKVRDMSGREIEKTHEQELENGKRKSKYRRLRLNSEDHKQISKFVGGTGFFGEHKIKSEKTCFVTEGLADCIVLNQFGFPCIALGSTGIPKDMESYLIKILKGKEVYLCFDNDANKAGQNGALKTGKLLIEANIKSKVITLPRGSEAKLDAAEFMKNKEAADFEFQKNKAVDFIQYALNTYPLSDNSEVEKITAAEKFVIEYLLNVPSLYRDAYIRDDVKRHFNLMTAQVKDLKHVADAYTPLKERKPEKAATEPPKESEQLRSEFEKLSKLLDMQVRKGFAACNAWTAEHRAELSRFGKNWLEVVERIENRVTTSDGVLLVKIEETFGLDITDKKAIKDTLLELHWRYQKEYDKLTRISENLEKYSLHVKARAEDILLHGDPQKFINDTWSKLHVGDVALGKTLLVCVVTGLIVGKNEGIHCKASGPSGKGKTSAIKTFLLIVPPEIVVKGGLSDKYLYYSDDILPGSICFVDDKDISEPLKELVKNCTSNFQHPEHHRTVINGEPKDLRAPERISWIFASVDGFDDEQMNNRFLQAEIDASPVQDSRVAEQQRKSEIADTSSSFREDNEVCRCIFDILRIRTYDIRIPFAEAIEWHHEQNRRNQPKFFDILRAVCLYNIHQRQQINGFFLATTEDYQRACEIYQETTVQNNVNLTAAEQRIINAFIKKNIENEYYKKRPLDPENAKRLTYEDLEDLTKINTPYLKKILNGKDSRSLGLGGKILGLGSEISPDGRHKKFFYYTGSVNFEIYQQFSNLKNEDEVKKAIESSINALKNSSVIKDEVEEIALQDRADVLPNLPALKNPSPFYNVTDLEEEKGISINKDIIYNNFHHIRNTTYNVTDLGEENDISRTEEVEETNSITLNKENILSELNTHKCNKEIHNVDALGTDTLVTYDMRTSSENRVAELTILPNDAEYLSHSKKWHECDGCDGRADDTDTQKVTDKSNTSNLGYTVEKMEEYLNKECHGNFIIKSLDDHITAFKRRCPEFQYVERWRLEFAFNKLLKPTPTLNKIPEKGEVEPSAVKKKCPGIEMLERALQAEKGKEAGI